MADKEAEISARLPGKWQAVWDEESRDYYYWNEETNETTWDDPSKPKKEPEWALPPGWTEEVDEQSGDVFFWNEEKNLTQWEPPAGSKRLSSAGAKRPSGAAGGAASGKAKKKRGVIMAESYDASRREDFKLPVYPKGEASKSIIRKTLSPDGAAGFLFSSLSASEIEDVVMAMKEKKLSKGEAIIKQGDHGNEWYVVEEGVFDIFVGDNKVASRTVGDAFGELALLYNAPRAASVVAAGPARVWALDRVTFRYMIASTKEDQQAQVVASLRKVPLLESLTDSQVAQVADAVQMRTFKPGDTIITKGESGDKAQEFYMLQEGSVMCKNIGAEGKELALPTGAYFGERALLLDEPRAADVVAAESCKCMVLDRKAFTELLGPLKEVLDHNLGIRVVSTEAQLANLGDKEKERMVAALVGREFAAGEVVQPGGAAGHGLFMVVKQGAVQLDGGVKVEAGACFGLEALMGSGGSRVPSATATEDKTAVLAIDKPTFERAVGVSLAKVQARKGKPKETTSAAGAAGEGADGDTTTSRLRTDIRFSDLEQIRILGAGTFGKVKLIRHGPSGEAMALKVLQKAQVVEYGQVKNIQYERDVLAQINHPFVLGLIQTFQDKDSLFMLLELVQGGELFTLLSNQETGCLPSDHAKFYAACTIAGLAAMHEKSIVYRDLKPENLLLDAQGFIKIVDMGFAKKLAAGSKTYTLCGTPEYLAPELVLGKGHGAGVDHWATGVLIYEMLVGYSPFADSSGGSDQMKICKAIVRGRLSWPSWMRDRDAKDLIAKLLVAKVTNRLGCKRNGSKDIMNHRWFAKDIDWIQLQTKKMRAPWVPKLKNPFDTSCFPDEYEDEPVTPYSGPQDHFKDF